MSDEGGEKTEEPTHKKLDDARRKGQVWKSKDLSGVFGFLVGLGVVKSIWPTLEGEMTKMFQYSFEKLAHPRELDQSVFVVLVMAVTTILLLTLPVVFATAITGGLMDFLQVGSLFSIESIMPKMDKLNALNGLKNLVSKKSLVELLKNLVKIFVTGDVVYGVVRDASGMVTLTIRSDAHGMLIVLGELVSRIAIRVGILFLMFAIFDVWWQRKSYMKDLMMSKDEVKREYKQSEGDPHHKAERRRMHHEILEGAQMEAVKEADVIVTNPDHVAIALKYDRERDGAPKLLCKGVDSRAESIKALARDSEVPMLRNVPLAHALLRVEIGDEIPEELYDAVAEVLNFVYGLKGAGPAAQA